MSPQVIGVAASSTTSAGGTMRTARAPEMILWDLLPDLGGTAARSLPLEDWPGIRMDPGPTGTSARASADPEENSLDTGAAIADLRRLSGVTWEELARVFGVSRRTLHFWASGRPINAANEERLHRLLAVLRQADRGTAGENRAMLFRDRGGTIPLDLLAAGRYEDFLALVSAVQGRRRIRLTPLSREARDARKPLPPEELVGARQNRVHRDAGHGRAARTARSNKRGRD